MGSVSALVFVTLIYYLLSVLNAVEHSERVIGNANEITKLTVDMETAMRGFVISGEESFLAPYQTAKPKIKVELAALTELVRSDVAQVDRLAHIEALQAQWDAFALTVIEMRRADGDAQQLVRSGRGKVQFDEIRKVFGDFLGAEQSLRQKRNDDAKRVTFSVVVLYLIFSLSLTGLLGFLGRRELLRLSSIINDALSQHQQHAESLERQAWQRAGQSQLAARNFGQMGLSPLERTVLDFLAQYVNAAVAALYARDDDGRLHRIAAYGFSAADEQRDQILDGNESLVAQAAVGERVIQLDNVPLNYLNVTSGLGQGTTRPISSHCANRCYLC
ncbi:MAG: CHASE3 domain-containing protein [Pseudomonadota bacterium]